ncbi:MAG: triose-phosphate isomerase [archaeon]
MVNYLFVNFKTYREGTGKNAVSLARALASLKGRAKIIPVVQALDLKEVASKVPLNVFAQHADPVSFGSNTGAVLPEALKSAGAYGTILNHAENKRPNEFIEKAVRRCRDAGLKVMLCAESIQRARELAGFSPDFIAVEPPELIGGDISVSTARPELISDSVEAIHSVDKKIIVITGAGIKNSGDVRKALELGTKGVFVASGIVKAENQKNAARELMKGFH